jgi:hypothetical protein
MSKMAKAKFPGELALALIALTMNDLEPVAVRYFRVAPDGQLHYMSSADIAAGAWAPPPPPVSTTPTSTTPAAVTDSGPPPAAPAPPALRPAKPQPFANLEIEFRPRGGGPTRIFRHISANLDDQHLTADPGVLRYLETKGDVTAITKAASYLLWWRGFSQIRTYLLGHMVWMISDSTGIPPENAAAAGFEQIPYGHFEGTFLKTTQKQSEAFQRLWADSAGSISFEFGYPDIAGNAHLMITRHPAK